MAAAALIKALPKIMKVLDGVQAVDGIVKQIGTDVQIVGNYVKKLGDRWVEMQDMTFKTARTMAMSREQALRYNESLIKSTKELAAQYGISAKELNDFQQSYSEAVGRNIVLSKQQLAHMSALAKITDSATAGQLVDEFDKIGVGIAGTTAKVGLMQERAKSLGINATKATKILKDNIQQAARYSFRNGVADIEKMSLKAASMRMDMNAIMSATERFADIEGAITNSANIQMLGGSFAREFSNPMGAMYEAMADPAAFQERILRTIQGKGKYDTKTGTVTFDPVTMRMMHELAKNLGMSVDQITNPAMAEVQNQKVEEELKKGGNFGGWTDKQLEAIKNLSRTNVDETTGKHFVTLLENGEEKRVNIENLTEEQLKIAQDSQMTEEGLWSDVQDIKTILERVHGRARETKSMKEGIEGVKEWWNATLTNLQDIYMPKVSDIFNNITNWFGTKFFASGGIAKPLHAEVGTIVPGTSYTGDRVPAMLNSGEMVLNPGQQKSMFNLISSLALNGGAMYGMNKLGGKFGYGGLGSTMMLANMLGGGKTDVSTIIEAHFIKKAIKSLNPLKTSIAEIGKVSETASESTSLFKTRWGELTGELSKDWKNFARRVSITTRRYFTTGNWGKITRAASSASSTVKNATIASGQFLSKNAKSIGQWIGKYTIEPLSKGWNKLINTKPITNVRGWKNWEMYKAKRTYSQSIKPKAEKYKNLFKNLFDDGSKAQASKAASRLQTPEIAMTGRHTGISQISKEGTNIAKAAGKGSKMLSNLGKVGKVVGKKIPYLGAVLAAGSAVSGIMGASSQYDKQVDEIERSTMSERDKARAKDRAAKEKNASIGGSVGSAAGGIGGMAAGAAAGAAIGSVVPVVGTAIGGLIGGALGAFGGEKLGGIFGKGIGSLFGGNEEKKLDERLEKQYGSNIDNTAMGDKAKALESINKNVAKIAARKLGLKGSILPSLSLPDIGNKILDITPLGIIPKIIGGVQKSVFEPLAPKVKALSDNSNFLKVAPSKQEVSTPTTNSIGKTDINLNVSGTIKLEGGGKSAEFDLGKLLDTPEFKRQLADIVTRRLNENSNSGKRNMESERNNMASQYNKSGR